MNAQGMRILALCDDPAKTSGFARVANNLLTRWAAAGAQIDVWGIGYDGGVFHPPLPYRIASAGDGSNWMWERNLCGRFILRLLNHDYTHVWAMQDSFLLCRHNFPTHFRAACQNIHVKGKTVKRAKPVRSVYYFPVDAMSLAPEWTEFMTAVDRPVAYTEQGKRAAEEAALAKGWKIDCAVVPHGVDPKVYHPRPLAERIEGRAQFHYEAEGGTYFSKSSDFIILNVNQHQRRKDIARTLEVFAAFQRQVPEANAKLVLHCARESSDGVNLETVAAQLGLVFFKDYVHHNELFDRGMGGIDEKSMCALFNIADCYLTTSMGEGWGLGITDALACGLPCVVPNHTSCAEIATVCDELGSDRLLVAGHELHGVALPQDNSRLRYRMDVQSAVDKLKEVYDRKLHHTRPEMPAVLQGWLDWDRIAEVMLAELKGEEQGRKGAEGQRGRGAELKIVTPAVPGVEVPA